MKQEIVIDGKVYWSRQKLTEVYGMSKTTLTTWSKNGLMPPVLNFGKKMYYAKDDVLALFANGNAAA